MNQPLPISASVEVAASPATVWETVSDVTRMSEWSPECRRIIVLGSKRSGVGTRLLGLNRRGWAVWPTTSTVVRFDPARAVAWRTRESGATWSYELEPTAVGTRLTGRRELPRFSVGTTVMAPLIGGAVGHDEELAAGIRTTLERIKGAVERG
ncbi:SRPBCC family protein [Nocardioides sp. WL0053]|uniref:SRPBCC family protein n=1 Tax=Nocardioides jiangsuensis TaxID=2866161 RepID=A0ABS7RNS7_9ACTN|nr:SRPBCC family protein [Nocardioides jiangsuensis]MBY9076698.1 SRPBCC family protein [Nocardioides jiangsuensis]